MTREQISRMDADEIRKLPDYGIAKYSIESGSTINEYDNFVKLCEETDYRVYNRIWELAVADTERSRTSAGGRGPKEKKTQEFFDNLGKQRTSRSPEERERKHIMKGAEER